MATAITRYGDEWGSTTLPYTGGSSGGDYDPMALIREIADFQDQRARRAAVAAREKPRINQRAEAFRDLGNRGRPSLRGPADPNRNLRLAAERAALRAQMAEANAVSQPPPMRMVNGPGIIPGLTMDVNRMSGAQRQVYLPQNSQQLPADPRSLAAHDRFKGLRDQREADRRARDEYDAGYSREYNQATNPFNFRRLAVAGYPYGQGA